MAAVFPMPFGGITQAIRLTGLYPDRVLKIICGTPKKGGGCGHKHNFAVDSGAKMVYVSPMGAECISRELDKPARKAIDTDRRKYPR